MNMDSIIELIREQQHGDEKRRADRRYLELHRDKILPDFLEDGVMQESANALIEINFGNEVEVSSLLDDTTPRSNWLIQSNKEMVRKIGNELNNTYGIWGMKEVWMFLKPYYTRGAMKELEWAWNRIGEWRV